MSLAASASLIARWSLNLSRITCICHAAVLAGGDHVVLRESDHRGR